jgi:iron-sulfur cluster repair protein YtfE (RIC family)
MPTLTEKLTGEHRSCDDLFAGAETPVADGNMVAARNGLKRFVAAMERHFRREEEVLFPAFEARTGQTQGPTLVMRGEHEQMRQLFRELQKSLGEGDGERFLGLSETLLILMQQHNAKEEQVLYPMSDQVLGGEAEALIERMEEV